MVAPALHLSQKLLIGRPASRSDAAGLSSDWWALFGEATAGISCRPNWYFHLHSSFQRRVLDLTNKLFDIFHDKFNTVPGEERYSFHCI